MAIDYSGLFTSPDQIRAERLLRLQQESAANRAMGGTTAGLLGQIAAGSGGMLAEGIAGIFGLKTAEEVDAEKQQSVLSSIDWNDPASVYTASQKLAEMGLNQAALQLGEKAQQLEAVKRQEQAHQMQMREGQANLDTAKLQQINLKRTMELDDQARARKAQQEAAARKYFEGSGRTDLATYMDMGVPTETLISMATAKTEPIKMKIGDGKEVLIDPKTMETLWEPAAATLSPTHSILPVPERDALAASMGTDLSGAIIEVNNETGGITFKKQPDKPVTENGEYKFIRDKDGQIVEAIPIKGTKAWEQAQDRLEDQKAKTTEINKLAKKVHTDVSNAMSIADDAMTLLADNASVGGVGSFLQYIPATDARDFEAKIETLKSGKSLEAYRAAKEAGVTFGSTTQAEWELLARQAQNLDSGQSRPQLMAQLEAFQAQQINALIALVNELPPEQLSEIGLGSLEHLRGKPKVTADSYPQAKAYFDDKKMGEVEQRKEENAWTIGGKPSPEQTQVSSWMAELDAMEGE